MRYRLRRPYRPWKGYVVKVWPREITLSLGPDGWRGPDVLVEYPRWLMWDARPGQRVSLLVTRRRTVLVERARPAPSVQLAEYRARMRELAAVLGLAPVTDDGSWEVVL